MKCENCGKNEVTFVYQSNINGHVEDKASLQRVRGRSWATPSGSTPTARG